MMTTPHIKLPVLLCGAMALLIAPVLYAAQNPRTSDARKYDEFPNVNCEDEMARLDGYAIELQHDPELRAYVVVYAGRVSSINEAVARAKRIRSYLVGNRHIQAERVRLIDGGYREGLAVELWIVPRGAVAPAPTPTLARKDVKVRKVRARVVDCAAAF